MSQWNSSHLYEKQLFFTARIPLPPMLAPAGYSKRSVRVNAKLTRYYVDAATALARAPIHDFGLIVALQESRFRIPLIASVKLYSPGNWNREVQEQANPVITATLRFLHLNRNPVVELHVQHYIDITDPHAVIALFCASSW